MTISRMQNPQQLQGIGSLRQPYGLGGFLKKAFRKIKKVAKSPLGKAAIIGGLGMIPFGGVSTWGRLGGMMKGFGGTKLGGMLSGGGSKLGGMLSGGGKGLGGWWGGLSPGKKIFTGLAGTAIAAPFLQKALKWGPYGGEEEEEEDWSVTPGSILNLRNQAKDYYKAATPDYTGSPFMPQKQFVMPNFYAAEGGLARLANGGEAGEAQMEQMLRAEYLKYKNQGGTMPYEQFKILVMKQAQQGQAPNQMMAAQGGRIKYAGGGNRLSELIKKFNDGTISEEEKIELEMLEEMTPTMAAGGRIGYNRGRVVNPGGYQGDDDTDFQSWALRNGIDLEALGGDEFSAVIKQWNLERPKHLDQADGGRVGAQEGGLMDLGGQEKDYREDGGFVPLGEEERADDVPARLSKNEFVFTADAVRAAGGGDIDAGSEVMQNVMDNLEQGGEVSEESQGQNPAQGMYNNYEQLQSRVA